MNLKSLYPSLYVLIKKGAISKSYIASKLYKEEWNKKNSNHSALTQRLNNKLDGKSSFSNEELKLLLDIFSALSEDITNNVDAVRKYITTKIKIKNLAENISETQLAKISDEQLVICWWSAGITSCVSTHLILKEYKNVKIFYIDTGGEDQDNMRFKKDCEEWYGKQIEVLKNRKGYKDHFDVLEKKQFLRNIDGGAPCTVELKKAVRFDLEATLNDSWLYQVFGFSTEEKSRAQRFSREFPNSRPIYPLIDQGLTKDDCFKIVADAGIKLPEAYKYLPHNNCIGCVKSGSKAYWWQIKQQYPEQFYRMAELERRFNYSLIKGVFLDELKNGGRLSKIEAPQCGIVCDEM